MVRVQEYNNVMEREDGMMQEQFDTSKHPENEAVQPEQDTRHAGDRDTREARISVGGGEPQLLIITLPEFRRGYEAGKQAILSRSPHVPFLVSVSPVPPAPSAFGVFPLLCAAPLPGLY